MNDLWERAYLNPNDISDDELQSLLNDRIGFVTDNLSTVGRHNLDETIFDLVMLFFDSLNEKRPIILKLWDNLDFNQKLVCKMQAQLTESIGIWHQELAIDWTVARPIQNILFMLALIYTSTIWKDDESPDSAKVMAKVNEITVWLSQSKSAPFDLLQKLKEKLMF